MGAAKSAAKGYRSHPWLCLALMCLGTLLFGLGKTKRLKSSRNRNTFFHHSLAPPARAPARAQVSFYLAELNDSTTRALRETNRKPGSRLRLRSGSRLRRRVRHRLPNTTYRRPPDTGACFLEPCRTAGVIPFLLAPSHLRVRDGGLFHGFGARTVTSRSMVEIGAY